MYADPPAPPLRDPVQSHVCFAGGVEGAGSGPGGTADDWENGRMREIRTVD
jgi:hypothetical protein